MVQPSDRGGPQEPPGRPHLRRETVGKPRGWHTTRDAPRARRVDGGWAPGPLSLLLPQTLAYRPLGRGDSGRHRGRIRWPIHEAFFLADGRGRDRPGGSERGPDVLGGKEALQGDPRQDK